MERHQTGQEEKLMEVIEMTEKWNAAHQPGRHSGCFKCVVTLATVMGLIIVAMVAGFILHVFMFTTPDNKDAKVQTLCDLTESGEKGKYEIFTAEKGADYLIFGWVAFSEAPNEEIILTQVTKEEDRTLQRKRENQTEIFFRTKVKMTAGAKISISFHSSHVDSKFLVYEL